MSYMVSVVGNVMNCFACPTGSTPNNVTKTCACNTNLKYYSSGNNTCTNCPANSVTIDNICTCNVIKYQYMNNNVCVCYDAANTQVINNECVCKITYQFMQMTASPPACWCPWNCSTTNSSACVIPANYFIQAGGYNASTSLCKPCPSGMTPTADKSSCVCSTTNSYFSATTGTCYCPYGSTNSSNSCNCPAGTSIQNISSVPTCVCDTKFAYLSSNTCVCPTDSTNISNVCTCPSGMTIETATQKCKCTAQFTLSNGTLFPFSFYGQITSTIKGCCSSDVDYSGQSIIYYTCQNGGALSYSSNRPFVCLNQECQPYIATGCKAGVWVPARSRCDRHIDRHIQTYSNPQMMCFMKLRSTLVNLRNVVLLAVRCHL
ncbi:Hypothetical_protein [Hexamita inflata]|uniref:Hypothetical_protein n=1 Tax=Hexamita inflata TaxID=28002 RepID=A0AA86R1B9_9EUKA|nr:Hypothetical protein HINF_LOCUS51429 [Hexamita inflata]